MADQHQHNKAALKTLIRHLYDFDEQALRSELNKRLAPEAICHFSYPVGDVAGAHLYDRVFAPLVTALPDLERRDVICIAGADQAAAEWVGCAGHYVGRFMAPFQGIAPTGQIVHLRFHEFFRFDEGRIVEIQAVWDLPGLMMQAGVWPMGPSLGCEGFVPGPASQDGLRVTTDSPDQSAASCQHVVDMLTAIQLYPEQGGPEVMQMDRYWHPHFNWYGPAGIGSSRGVDGFRRWHQTPFLNAMPDRGQHPEDTSLHFFAEGPYVAVTGWPNMAQTLSQGGWLGIAPTNQKITLRSLDFWRLEDGRIRENWVLVDLLDIWAQIGVDVLQRMTELASARPGYTAQIQQEAAG